LTILERTNGEGLRLQKKFRFNNVGPIKSSIATIVKLSIMIHSHRPHLPTRQSVSLASRFKGASSWEMRVAARPSDDFMVVVAWLD
jgi:hypothetical protein